MHTNRQLPWLLLAALTGCAPTALEGKTAIRFAGATFPAPLYQSWTETYGKSHPQLELEYEAVGSGEGIRRFLAEEVDLGASDAALSDEQIAKVSRGALLIPVTAGSVTLAYNPAQLPSDLKLSRSVYSDIFLGKITHWNDERIAQLNPGAKLPELPISIVVRRDGSGTTYAFTNHLSAISEEWRKGPGVGRSVKWPRRELDAPGNDKVAREVQFKPGALAYLEFGVATRAKLGIAVLENKSGAYVSPSAKSSGETLRMVELPKNLRAFFPDPEGAEAYPIVTFTWVLVYERYDSKERAKAVRDFLGWCLTEGQELNEQLGYVRLSSSSRRPKPCIR